MKYLSLFLLLISSTNLFAQTDTPCFCCSDNHRAFDFWVGEWNVYDQSGTTLLGTSHISLQNDGCILQEEWTSAQGNYSGRSLNSVDNNTGTWRQHWVDSQGNILQLSGGLENGVMVMTHVIPEQDTIPETINHLSWTPLEDGRVHQVWKTSTDNGETWISLFDGYYAKKEEE